MNRPQMLRNPDGPLGPKWGKGQEQDTGGFEGFQGPPLGGHTVKTRAESTGCQALKKVSQAFKSGHAHPNPHTHHTHTHILTLIYTHTHAHTH